MSDRPNPWRAISPALAAVGAALFALGVGLGYTRLLPGMPAFAVAMGGAALSALAVLVGLVALARGRRARAGRAIGLGLVAPAIVIVAWVRLAGAPPIHDVSTDLADPPPIVDVAGGIPEDTHAAHRAAYGDLAPLVTPRTPEDAVTATLRVIASREGSGWAVVRVDRDGGLVHATAESGVFGFVDDVTVRVRPRAEGGSLVDVRSRSREGRSDFGANARRIRGLLAEFTCISHHPPAATGGYAAVSEAYSLRLSRRASARLPSPPVRAPRKQLRLLGLARSLVRNAG